VTRISHSYSNIAYLSSGVVQGSCIGPILFFIYVNDVSEVFPDGCICKFYADDIKLYSAMKTVNDCKNLQESLDVLYCTGRVLGRCPSHIRNVHSWSLAN